MEQLKRYEPMPPSTIHDAVENLSRHRFVIPTFQRRIVWGEMQIRDLFDTIINNNLFGSISAIKQESGDLLFDYYREFDLNSDKNDSEPISNREGFRFPLYFIIDGQQRLTVLHNVLKGTKILFFDLDNCQFQLEKVVEGLCLKVNTLYSQLEANNPNSYIEYCDELGLNATQRENLFKFYYSFFFKKSINFALVYPNINDDLETSKKRFINLFIKLNTGGTNLEVHDVALCTLKGYLVEYEPLIDYVYEIGNSIYNSFPNVFFDSLVLYKEKHNDSEDYSQSVEDDYRELYEQVKNDKTENDKVGNDKSENNNKESQSNSTNSNTTKDADANENNRCIEFKYRPKILYTDDILNFDFLRDKSVTIKKVIETVKPLLELEEIKDGNIAREKKTILKSVLPIILARLYYSNDIEYSTLKQKLTEYGTCDRLVIIDLTSIDKLSINNFYTQMDYDD
jgi:hypothetical protein